MHLCLSPGEIFMVSSTSVNKLILRLEGSPHRFAQALSRLTDSDTLLQAEASAHPAGLEVARVRAADDILEARIIQVLVRDSTPLIGFDENVWLDVAGYGSMPVSDLLHTMMLKRKELINALRLVAPDGWERTGTHEVRGAMSVFEIATQLAELEDEHLSRIVG